MSAGEGIAAKSYTRARRQAVVTGLVGLIGMSIGTLIVTGLMGGFSLPSLVPQPEALIWAAAVVLLLPYVGGSDARLALAAVAAALLIAVATAVAQIGGPAGGAVLFVVAGWKALTLGCAAVLGSIAGVIHVRRPAKESLVSAAGRQGVADSTATGGGSDPADDVGRRRREQRVAPAILFCLVVGVALFFALPVGWFGVYFSIWDVAEPPTTEEVARYEWTAGLAIAALALAMALAIVRRRRGLIITSAVVLVCTFIAAFVFQVPQGRFIPDPAPVVHDDLPVCYGTTGDCPGG